MKFNILKKADEHEFKPLLVEIEDEPTSPMGRFILLCLFAAVFIGLIMLTFFKIDVVVSSRGLLIPEGEIKIVQPLEGGIVAGIYVKVGDYVDKGALLMDIDPSVIEPDFQSKTDNLARLTDEKVCLEEVLHQPNEAPSICTIGQYIATYDNMNGQIEAKKYQIARLHEQTASLTGQIQILSEMLSAENDRLKRLDSVIDIISIDDYKSSQDTILRLMREKNDLEHTLRERSYEISQLTEEISLVKGGVIEAWEKEYSELIKSYTSLKAEVDQMAFRHERQHIYAPVNGHINELFVNTVGGVVTSAQELLSVVPADTNLVAKALVLNKDIGFITVGQECVLKIDTFDFQKYGKITGKILSISSDSIEDENLGRVYPVYIQPDSIKMTVDGRETALSSGMSLTLEVKVGKRRVIELFIYPAIKYLDEGLSVR